MKEDILKAAWQEFARDGYHASMSKIAGKVGLRTSSLYSHYTSKDEILLITVSGEIESFYGLLRSIDMTGMNCEEKLHIIYQEICQYFRDIQRVKFWRQIPLVDETEFRLKCREVIITQESGLIGQIADIFAQGQEEGALRSDVDAGAMKLFVAMLQGILDGILLYSDYYDIDIFISETWQTFWRGIRR